VNPRNTQPVMDTNFEPQLYHLTAQG